jgi:2-desacetyl-2-hydroxyethyl bacteriochlorophyllide A dehydrogenase
MRQVLLERPGAVSIAEVPPQKAGSGEALVRLRLGGICGSDLSAYRGASPMVSYPRVLGHELLVDVLECAGRPEIVGQRAVIEPLIRCGQCRACRSGRYNCCVNLRTMGVHVDGGLQDIFAVDCQQVYPVPPHMPDEVAVLAEPLTIAYHAVQRAQIEAGRIALVFGAGTIGLLIAQLLARARGCRPLVADIDEQRLSVAGTLGAIPVQGDQEALMRQVKEATDGEMADVVFEATGNAACTRMTTDLVAHTGRIVLVGWNKGPVEVDTVTLMRKEVDLLGSRNSANAFPPVLRLLSDGAIDADTLITHRFPLSDADTALDVLDQGVDHALKIVLTRE